MSKRQAINELFKPNQDGISEWINKDIIREFRNGILDWGNNGVFRWS